jgi:hypothetical protein
MKYDPDDPRASDLAGRISYLQTMGSDADAIAHALERFAAQKLGDFEWHGYLRRLSTACRDFHGQISMISASAPQKIRDAIAL